MSRESPYRETRRAVGQRQCSLAFRAVQPVAGRGAMQRPRRSRPRAGRLPSSARKSAACVPPRDQKPKRCLGRVSRASERTGLPTQWWASQRTPRGHKEAGEGWLRSPLRSPPIFRAWGSVQEADGTLRCRVPSRTLPTALERPRHLTLVRGNSAGFARAVRAAPLRR